MKKLLVTLCITCALSLAAQAADGKKEHKDLTPEQRTILKDMRTKYDADKDGKLSKEEKGKISSEDKEKMKKAGLGEHKKKKKN